MMAVAARFDSVEHLEAWKRAGAFPAIHTAMAGFVEKRARHGARILDLCCNHGLLGEQLTSRMPGSFVMGIDGDALALARGRTAGVRLPTQRLRIDPSTYDELEAILRDNQITTVVARRCLPELLGDVMWSAPDFAASLRSAGVTDLFLQGRVPTSSPNNPLHTIDLEVRAVASHFALTEQAGPLAHLVGNRVEPGRSDGAGPEAGARR
jgi:hypothetical protein